MREFLVRLFAIAGLIVGALMGFAARPGVVDHASCRDDACISAGLVAHFMPLLMYAFGGFAVGGLIGLALALLVRFDRRP